MNYTPQYYDKMNKQKEQDNNIDTGYKWKLYASVPLLELLKTNYHVPIFHLSSKKIKDIDMEDMIPQFCVGYMSMPIFLIQKKTFRDKVKTYFRKDSIQRLRRKLKTLKT